MQELLPVDEGIVDVELQDEVHELLLYVGAAIGLLIGL
jgi:hypothetical protein